MRRPGKTSSRNFSVRLKTQLIASFMATSVFVLLISAVLADLGTTNIIKNQSEKEKIKQLQQLDYNINSLFREVEKISRRLIISQNLKDYINGYYSDDFEKVSLTKSIYEELSRELNNYDYIKSIFYYGDTGWILGVTQLRNESFVDKEKTTFFYHSELYDMVKADALSVHWCGSYTPGDFELSGANTPDSTQYLSAARSINLLGKQAATIVINIDESYFTSIYNNGNAGPDLMYIMDRQGKILSDTDTTKLNSPSDIFGELTPSSQYGSTISRHGQTARQVIYLRMSEQGWIMVDEIPLSQLLSGINEMQTILTFVLLLSIVLAFSISMYWIRRITRPLNELTTAMRAVENGMLGNLLPENSKNELGLLGRQFNKMSKSIYSLIENIKSIETEKRQIEIKALQAQINPHFLYNTLNTIKYMAAIHKANNVAESLTVLGNLLRPIFKNPEFLCTIREEVEYASDYIKIMNLRYGEGIQVNLDIPQALMECVILRFILQPMIENSLEHGIVSQNYIGVIHIAAMESAEGISLVVEDNGSGMDEDRLTQVRNKLAKNSRTNDQDNECIGLNNVNRRIRLHYGDCYGIDVFSEQDKGTRVVLRLPKITRM